MTTSTAVSSTISSSLLYFNEIAERIDYIKSSVSDMNLSNLYRSSSSPSYVIHPVTHELIEIDPDQAWFWASNWIRGEMEVEKELQMGQYDEFEDIDDFLEEL